MKKNGFEIKAKRVARTYKLHPYTILLLDVLSQKTRTGRTELIESLLWLVFKEGKPFRVEKNSIDTKALSEFQEQLKQIIEKEVSEKLDKDFLRKLELLEQFEKQQKKAA